MNSHLSTFEAAQILRCSSENVRLLARSGRLPTAIRDGGRSALSAGGRPTNSPSDESSNPRSSLWRRAPDDLDEGRTSDRVCRRRERENLVRRRSYRKVPGGKNRRWQKSALVRAIHRRLVAAGRRQADGARLMGRRSVARSVVPVDHLLCEDDARRFRHADLGALDERGLWADRVLVEH